MRMLTAAKFVLAVSLSAGAANAATTIVDFNDLTAPGFSGEFQVFATSVGGIAAAPNATPFLAIPSDQAASGTAIYTATNSITAFSFDWGTPDDYNTLGFYNGDTLVSSLTGTGLVAGNYAYSFLASAGIDNIRFTSSNRAFEIDNVSVTAVPEPTTWALLLAGFAMVGVAARRRVRTVAA